ncbi:hypothetical protein SAMN02799630_00323 [Paenibacillus sp. UNCCL117]|uniref:hypothetical protein n=1 Tax=unclassified Paenibacillus TaxID=185978 RepID=UPI0008860A2D|nr:MULTISPECIES: hypothetical protein [unclassified Paenibacillus]SDC44054.1 hypothetical protein SAMN04488602_102209 [Paenibacillus sp. cl123]SFW12821.1 hypothetical protein SAMN02799630_00323 [Paenibacillus sp. UNCCL117]
MPVEMSFCSHCNERIPAGSIACKYCGTFTHQAGGNAAAVSAAAPEAKTEKRTAKWWTIGILAAVVVAAVIWLLVLQ